MGASHVIPSSEYETATPRWGAPDTTLVYNPVSPIAINRRRGLKTFAPHPCHVRPLVEYATVFVPHPVAIHRRAPHVIPRPQTENTVFPSPCHVADASVENADAVAITSVKVTSVFTVPRPVAMKLRPFQATPCAYMSNPVVGAPLSATPVHDFPSIEYATV